MKFLTVDFNGWLDRILDPDGKEQALGFRSCFYKHQDQWLVGAQALAAARFAYSPDTIDAIDALACAAGHRHGLLEQGGASPLPASLWNLVGSANRADKETIHLALIVPDNQFFGSPRIVQEGKTRLEILYDSLYSARQSSGLMTSQFELVWRSVAVLQAVLDEGKLKDQEGKVLVVSVNQKIFWRVLRLRDWSRGDPGNGPICIQRTPMIVSRNYCNVGEKPWMKDLLTRVEDQYSVEYENLSKWTRCMELLVTNPSSETLDQLDIDASAIEHRTWPFDDGENVSWRTEAPMAVPKNYAKVSILKELIEIIEKFLSRQEETPIAVIIENPIDDKIFDHIQPLRRILSEKFQIHYVSGADTARAAARLANVLAESNHPKSPAWLDSVPEIQLKVRKKTDDGRSYTDWKPVISGDEVVPAGELYSTQPDEERRIILAPGIEYVHLHLNRGGEGVWEERYTQHAIDPSDHERVVEPLARVRPLSEVARIEIVEHLMDDKVEALVGSTSGLKWNELTSKRPTELSSIPELYIFESSDEGWENLKSILEQIVESGRHETDPSSRIELRNDLYMCTNQQWKSKKFPLGSDGQPPRTSNGRDYIAAQQLLRDALGVLVSDLEHRLAHQTKMKSGEANRLHMGLTWLFTGCPEEVTNFLLDSIINPSEKTGKTLHMGKNFSAWSIYSGVGRTAKSEESLRIIYDTLIRRWENKGGQKQDKFLLAAVSHPLARRFLVRQILSEDQKRFLRVKRFLCRQLDNIVCEEHDQRPNGKQPSLELRYVIMGFRGLCQIRHKNYEWFPAEGSEAKGIYKKLMQLKNSNRFRNKEFEQELLDLSAPYLIGKGEDPTMPGGF